MEKETLRRNGLPAGFCDDTEAQTTLRFATVADSAALRAVYAPYIDTSVTFEYALPTEAEFAKRIEEITAC